MGSHGVIPSNTSRYISADVGLIHMVGLDLNNLDAGQLAWLEADLINVNRNRSKTPWIIVMSHFPVFHTRTAANANMSAAHYIGDELMGEYATDGTKMEFAPCPADKPGCQTVGEFQAKIGQSLQPLFRKYGVDLYNAGHVHSYENTWPLCDFTTGELCRDSNGTVLKTMDEPRGTVHITEGNGGVPGVPATFGVSKCSPKWEGCRVVGTGGAYGRITATSTTLTYDRIANNGGSVTDTWTITQHNHGPFPAQPPAPPPPPPAPPAPSVVVNGCFSRPEVPGKGVPSATVECARRGQVISAIEFASWGTPTGACSADGASNTFKVGKCNAPDSVAVFTKLCLGKTSCTFSAISSMFGGDPCAGVVKTVDLAVTCKRPRVV